MRVASITLSLALLMSSSILIKSSSANTPIVKQSDTISLQQVVQNPSNYIGKSLTLNGKVDRVLPSGDFIMKAPNSDQSILILTVKPSSTQEGGNQRAGTLGAQVKQDQNVKVTGRLDQLVVTNEYDVLNLRKNRESIDITQASTPILLVRPSDVKIQ